MNMTSVTVLKLISLTFPYSDAYEQYISDIDNNVKFASLVAKNKGKLTEEEY